MKTKRIIFIGWLWLVLIEANGQSAVKPRNLEVAYYKTSSILFKAPITSVDRGSRDLLARKAQGVHNVLQLKAARKEFPQTNLTVITADGTLHHFDVHYNEDPVTLVHTIPMREDQDTPSLLFLKQMTKTQMEALSDQVLKAGQHVHRRHTGKYKVSLSLRGIYIQDQVMFYHIRIVNKSNIPYQPQLLQFFIEDKIQAKRTASQELLMAPLHCHSNQKLILGNTSSDLVYALPKFTIPNAKRLVVELMEEHGGRHLRLGIKNRDILRAQPVPGHPLLNLTL